jgi:cytochrome c oxidase subunit 3
MLIFLGSWSMMFAALFAAYGVLRLRGQAWPPPELPPLPLVLPGINTALIAASSVALQRALWAARRGHLAPVAPAIGVALLLGCSFLGGQFLLWRSLWIAGLRPDGGPYASVFFALTAFHAAHVLVGVCGLLYLLVRARTAAYGPLRHATLRLWSGFWHFVGAVWLLLYVTVFVL